MKIYLLNENCEGPTEEEDDQPEFRFPEPTEVDRELISAAHDGDLARCLSAIGKGARLDAVDRLYATPLGEASWSNSPDIVRILLEKGADPNLLDGGKTPLMEAANRQNREIIDMLIDAGANVFAKAELAPGAFIDVPYMAHVAQGRDPRLAVELRSLINQQKRIKDGTRLRLKDVAEQLDLDEDGKPKKV